MQTHHVSRSSGAGPTSRTGVTSEVSGQNIGERFSRRQILAGAGVGGAIALAGGWYRFIREPAPIKVTKKWWRLYEAGDLDGTKKLYHSDSPSRPFEDVSEQEYGPPEEASWTIKERRIIDRTETEEYKEVTVREIYIWEDSTGRDKITDDVILRTENGEWKIWEVSGVETEELTES